jgi:hypothetical protein
MRNGRENNIAISQDEPDDLMREVKELVKKRDFDEFCITQVRTTTQLFTKLRRVEENLEEMNNKQKAFLDSIKENVDSLSGALDGFTNIYDNKNLPSSSSLSSPSAPKILYTVLTKKMSSIHKRAKFLEEGALSDSAKLDEGLVYNLHARFTDTEKMNLLPKRILRQ